MASSIPRPNGRAHPVHGLLAAFPLAFFTGALVTDIIYARSANMMWANFSAWQITFGLIGGVLAALAGIVDAIVHRGAARGRRRGGTLHNLLSILTLAFALVNAFVHSRDAWTSVVPSGLAISVVTVVLAVVSSWLGFVILAREGAR